MTPKVASLHTPTSARGYAKPGR